MKRLGSLQLAVLTIFVLVLGAIGTGASAQTVLPKPEPPFQGEIGRTVKDTINPCTTGGAWEAWGVSRTQSLQ